MKKAIAAFLWDGTTKSISFLIIDDMYSILFGPQKYQLDLFNFKEFKHRVEKLVLNFYREIRKIYEPHQCAIQIEYKIVHKVSHDLAEFFQPSDRSDFVRTEFLTNYKINQIVIKTIKLSQQLRSRLKRPELDEFKQALRHLHIVKPGRNNTYQYHLWILATHATKSNYDKVIKRLAKTFTRYKKQA